jgi:GDP-D-mannose dehydratase
MKKKTLITGITGQDGSYLTEYLLSLVVRIIHRYTDFVNRMVWKKYCEMVKPMRIAIKKAYDCRNSQVHLLEKVCTINHLL